MPKYKEFEPNWCGEAKNNSLRAIVKWGDGSKFYIPAEPFYKFQRDALHLTDEDFSEACIGESEATFKKEKSGLDTKDLDTFKSIVGDDNISLDASVRLAASFTKNSVDALNIRRGILPPLVDAVVYPSTESELSAIQKYAKKRNITLVTVSALIPIEVDKKTVAVDLTKNYNRLRAFSEVDSYVTVESGMYLTALENIINNASDSFRDYRVVGKYTVGHFPLEYEECSVLDCVNGVKYGSESCYYGSFDDIVIEKEYVCVDGETRLEYEEGAILSSVKLKMRRFYPENRFGFSFMFRTFQEGQNALREIFAKEGGIPHMIRLSGANDTSMLMSYYHLTGSVVDGYLKARKYKDKERCLMIGFSGGAYSYSRNAYNTAKRIAKKYRGISLTTVLADAYDESRFNEMYVFEALADFGIIAEREMSFLRWSEMPEKNFELAEDEGTFKRCRIVAPSRMGAVVEVVTEKSIPMDKGVKKDKK